MSDAEGKGAAGANKDSLHAILSGPAVYSNKIYLTLTPMGVRLSFVEVLEEGDTPAFRTAVFLSYVDALKFRDLLNEQLKKVTLEINEDAKERPNTEGRDNG